MSAPPRRPPGNLSHLQRLANTAATDASIPAGRYQRWINTHIISAVLDRVHDENGEPLFTLKGGAAMELRLGLTARASKDYDAAFRARPEDMLDALDQALAADWQGFQLQRTEPETIRNTQALRMSVKLSYKGRAWGTVQLEIAPAEGVAGQEVDRVPARPLDPVQLDGPDRIACVSVRYQIAQKLHACTEVYDDGRENDRFRDLIDLPLLRDLTDDATLGAVKDACVEIFALRGKHAWPPTVTVWPSWPAGFEVMARENAFYTDDVDVAAENLRVLIAEIDGSSPTIRVRHATDDDAAQIAAVHVAAWQAAYRGLIPDALLDGLNVDERAAMWRELTGRDGTRVFAALRDERVVGFCALVTPSRDDDADADVAEIGAIYVHPDAWRNGIGRALMDAAMADLRAAGWRSVTLWVLAENQPARDFYASFGLVPDGAEKTDADTGEIEMRLRAPGAR